MLNLEDKTGKPSQNQAASKWPLAELLRRGSDVKRGRDPVEE